MSILNWSHKNYKSCDIEDEHRCFAYLELGKISGEYGYDNFVLKFEITPVYSQDHSSRSYTISVYSFLGEGFGLNEIPISQFNNLASMDEAKKFAETIAVGYVKETIEKLQSLLDSK